VIILLSKKACCGITGRSLSFSSMMTVRRWIPEKSTGLHISCTGIPNGVYRIQKPLDQLPFLSGILAQKGELCYRNPGFGIFTPFILGAGEAEL